MLIASAKKSTRLSHAAAFPSPRDRFPDLLLVCNFIIFFLIFIFTFDTQYKTIRYKKFFGFFLIETERFLTSKMDYQLVIGKMPLSARNRIEGVVKEIEKGEVASTVKIEITKPSIITSMITKEAAEDLDLKAGDEVEAVIKASEVMVSKD
jgi:molybdate transport system regulatory protein